MERWRSKGARHQDQSPDYLELAASFSPVVIGVVWTNGNGHAASSATAARIGITAVSCDGNDGMEGCY